MRALGKRFRSHITPAYSSSAVLGEMSYFLQNRWQTATEVFKDFGWGDQRIRVNVAPPYTKAEFCWDDLHPGPPWKSGGPFTKVTLEIPSYSEVQGFSWHERPGMTFHHPMLGFVPTAWNGGYIASGINEYDVHQPVYGDVSLALLSESLAPDTSQWGPEAWAKTAPRTSAADGFVFLAEMRDLPRTMMRSSKEFHEAWNVLRGNTYYVGDYAARQLPRQASESFLNTQFGWIPFLKDMGKFSKAYDDAAKWKSRMTIRNDRFKVYRRTLLDDFQATKIHSGSGWKVIPFGQFHESHLTGGQSPTFEVWEETSTHVTTSGRFKWYKPEFDATLPDYSSQYNDVRRLMTMYGVRVNPSTVWRATPWTWLIDWGIDMGRNIDRVTEYLVDGVVAEYLYIMALSVRRLVFKQTIPFTTGSVTFDFSRIIEVKQRTPAGSPFGFGSAWESLTPRRLAILAALGITRTSYAP